MDVITLGDRVEVISALSYLIGRQGTVMRHIGKSGRALDILLSGEDESMYFSAWEVRKVGA